MLPAPGLKIPHMGWNSLTITKKFALFENVPDKSYVYFVHSFACRADNPEHVLAVTEYGVPFHSAVGRDNITGLQFHPEKSYLAGQTILKNFAAMAGL